MTSRAASGEALRRIGAALALWNVTGYVRWADKPQIEDWLNENLDRTKFTKREIARRMHAFVAVGGAVKEQDNPPDGLYDADVWYAVELDLDGVRTFIKFVLEPDEMVDPGILIVSVHD